MSLHVHVYKLCFAILNDQLGVANFANTFDSAHLVCICVFENVVLHVWFASCVFFLQIQVTHVFVLQPLLGHLVWGEPAM